MSLFFQNSNQYASYPKFSNLDRQIDDLIEYEVPMSSTLDGNRLESDMDLGAGQQGSHGSSGNSYYY